MNTAEFEIDNTFVEKKSKTKKNRQKPVWEEPAAVGSSAARSGAVSSGMAYGGAVAGDEQEMMEPEASLGRKVDFKDSNLRKGSRNIHFDEKANQKRPP